MENQCGEGAEGEKEMGVDRCVVCGEIIPEGSLVCRNCMSEWISSIVLPADGMPDMKEYAAMETAGTGQISDAWMIRVRDGRDRN